MTASVLIYDGECPLCCTARDWVLKKSPHGSIEALPCQSDERKNRFPQMEEAQCMEAMQLVLPDGDVLSGEKALPNLLSLLNGWKWLAGFLTWPLVRHTSPIVYRIIARNRLAFSILISRKGEGAHSCSTDDSCSIGSSEPDNESSLEGKRSN
jgi:predicted DCC family thiol-disulfide oxidoreductase YuxK